MSKVILGFGLAAFVAGCSNNVDSPTELNPSGPPMIRQVIMTELITDAQGVTRNALSMAFGSHPDFDPNDDGVVTNGLVGSAQRIRVVVDELLVGNYLEEIQCRDGTYAAVPEGATPDDIANCAVQADLLPALCVGDHAVCLGPDGPIGVMDEDENGSVDDTRFIDGAVSIQCGAISPQMSLVNSFYQPSGNQQVPAAGGFNAIGPAVILSPTLGLPTSSDCTIVFDDTVVDKDHHRVCAPADGDVDNDCDEGDTSLVQFGTQALTFTGSSPPNNGTNIPLTAPSSTDARILVIFNAPVDDDIDATWFTLEADGNAVTNWTAARDAMVPQNVTITLPGGYTAGTTYTLTIETGAKDTFGIALPDDEVTTVTWTTVPA